MKTSTVVAALAPAVVSADWWGGAPECAQSCLSSAYASATASASSSSNNGAPYWPAQSDYCNSDKGNKISSCMADGCKATPTAVSSYAKLSSSLCSQWASCTAAGSTGVHTVTLPGGPVTWGAPGGWGPNNGPNGGSKNFGGNGGGMGNWGGNGQNGGFGNNQQWSEWASAYSGSKTWTGGVVTVTGCMNDGSPWFSGPGCGWNQHGGFNGWVGWGNGWKWGATTTSTVTVTTTDAANNNAVSTFTGLATVAAAISGDLTTSTTIGIATSTGSANGNGAARVGGSPVGGSEGSMITGMMGIGLGAVIVIAGML
ncbi:hypothetical protein PG995_006988 [Apiospora arundinis]|uniref:Uncharacterized protein n=1 Tax=Apiospora arundinis TaxID=335852 RepID=A0ABR2JJ70_9PEZI